MIQTTSSSASHVCLPYTVIIDTREQHPYSFTGFKGDARQGNLPLIIPTHVSKLDSGDYSIQGFENQISVERKSLADFYSTLTTGRRRFEAEMLRLSSMEVAAVVVEASLTDLIFNPPPRCKVSPKVIYRSWISWQHRWRIPFHLCDTRSLAERTTFRILNWFWEEKRKIEIQKIIRGNGRGGGQ